MRERERGFKTQGEMSKLDDKLKNNLVNLKKNSAILDYMIMTK